MPEDSTHREEPWNRDLTPTEEEFDDDEEVADGMVDDDDVFDLASTHAALSGRPQTSWEAIIDNIARVRQGRA